MSVNSIPLQRIKLTLARSKGFPDGSTHHGYEFVAPLNEQGLIDATAWKASRADCTVRRFWAGQDDETGMLAHKAGGAEHSHWVFDYDPKKKSDDESGFLFGKHKFMPGEYVSVRGADGEMHTFSVASVAPIAL